ncbi:MAG: hypothetical protein Q8Q13_03815 [bacterium]|nr:hypothetical protein [bacterium]
MSHTIALARKVYNDTVKDSRKKTKFNFEELKTAATSENATLRKKVFEEYFEQFEEFPSYLFDNEGSIDSKLAKTISDIENDPDTSARMRKGIAQMLNRLPSRNETA